MWAIGFAEKQHSLEKLHNFLLHKNGVRFKEDSLSPPPPPPQPAPQPPATSMIETPSRNLLVRSSPATEMSPSSNQSHNNDGSTTSSNYLTTAMMLTSQNCNYLGQFKGHSSRLAPNSLALADSQSPSPSPPAANESSMQFIGRMGNGKQHAGNLHPEMDIRRSCSPVTAFSGTPNSLFTIDSILAPKSTSNPSSPQSPSATSTNSPTPIRPSRVPALLHPGLHLGHLAAAASGFGATTDFLGELFRVAKEGE